LLAANTHPKSNTIYGVWSSTDGIVFAAAESGTVFRIEDKQVKEYALPAKYDFYDVFGFSAHDVYVVGTYGSIFHFDGVGWKEDKRFTSIEWLEAVWGRSPDDLYVAGDESSLWHFNGASWSKIDLSALDQNKIPNRFYSIGGNPENDITYVIGSRSTIIIIEGDQVSQFDLGFKANYLGIQHIPGTDRFLICGSGGTLLSLDQGNDNFVEKIETHTRSYLYGIDARSQDEIVVVGWWGDYLTYNGQEWKKLFYGSDSFMEGVVHIGSGKYSSGGWYGRILQFDFDEQQWSTLQTGRAEQMNATTIVGDHAIAVGDTGSVICLNMETGKSDFHYVPPNELYIAYSLTDDNFLIAGDKGQMFIGTIKNNSIKFLEVKTQTKSAIRCVTSHNGVVWVAGQDGLLASVDGQCTFAPHSLYRNIVGTSDAFAVAFFDDDTIYYQDSCNKIHCVTISTEEHTEDAPTEDECLLFGRDGVVYCISDKKLFKLRGRKWWQYITSLKDNFASKNEFPTTATVDQDKDIWVGGSRGSIIAIDKNDSSIKQTYHGMSYTRIFGLSVQSKIVAVGFDGGRLTTVYLEKDSYFTSSISAPIYYSASAIKDSFFVCGSVGTVATFSPPKDLNHATVKELLATVILEGSLGNAKLGDLLASVKLGDFIYCGGVGGLLRLDLEGKVAICYLDGKIVTTLTVHADKLLVGCSNGEIYNVNPTTCFNNQPPPDSITLFASLPGIPIHIIQSETMLQVVTEDGYVLEISLSSPTIVTKDSGVTLRRPSSQSIDDKLYIAGIGSFLASVSDEGIRPIELAEKITDITLHGTVFNLGDYWVGGYSGTLLIMQQNETKLKVHSGIGNHLFSIASTSKHVLICGKYGAIRWDDFAFIETELKKEDQ
jgi:hypothetical protein